LASALSGQNASMSARLLHLINKNIGCPVKFGYQINKELFLVYM
jgi:hypothetical protein